MPFCYPPCANSCRSTPTYRLSWLSTTALPTSSRNDSTPVSAIDHHGMPDHEGCRIRAKPDDSGANLLGRSHPPDRLLCDHPLPPLGGASAEPVHHRGFDDPRAHYVHADIRLRIIERGRLGEADHGVFRGTVRGLTREAFDAGARAGVPVPAPVMNATFPANLPLPFIDAIIYSFAFVRLPVSCPQSSRLVLLAYGRHLGDRHPG